MRQQGKILKHHAHLVASELDEFFVVHLEQIVTFDLHRAGRGLDQTRDATHESRFPRARQPHDNQYFTGTDIQGDVVDRGNHAFTFQDGGLDNPVGVLSQICRTDPEDFVQRLATNDGLRHVLTF